MFTEQELFTRLHAKEMDQSELETIIVSHFHGASAPSPNEVIFPGTPDLSEVALRFEFKKGQLATITAGPALTEEDLVALQAAIESELAPAAAAIRTEVLFSKIPVGGAFRHEDVLQVLPVPSDAPCPPMRWADHPFLLQFRYKASHASLVGAARREAYGRKLQLLLSVLLEGGIRNLRPHSRFHWVVPQIDPGKPPLPPKSTYCPEAYAFEGMSKFAVDSFCDTAGLALLPLVDPVKYYTRVGIGSDQMLSAPTNLSYLLERFFSSSEDEQERFIRSCFWFNHADEVHVLSRSASFTSLISAIESLIPTEPKQGDCPICKRPVGKGALRRLNEFLDQYAPADPKFQASRVALYYQFRSSLSHGGTLSYFDRNVFAHSLGGKYREEQELFDEVWRLVKIVLVNWLHSRNPLLIPTKGRGKGIFAFGSY